MHHSFESLDTQFGCPTVAYVDYAEALPFVIRACAEKKTLKVIDEPVISQHNMVEQLSKAEQCLHRWYDHAPGQNWHRINLQNFLFLDLDRFKQEYHALCEYYKISPVLEEATVLREHWLSLQWRRPRPST